MKLAATGGGTMQLRGDLRNALAGERMLIDDDPFSGRLGKEGDRIIEQGAARLVDGLMQRQPLTGKRRNNIGRFFVSTGKQCIEPAWRDNDIVIDEHNVFCCGKL